jgi:hypothetical protein
MMGTSVLTLVLAGCFAGMGQAMVLSENVKSSNFAAQALEAEMESLRTKTWDEINAMRETTRFRSSRYFGTVILRDGLYTRSITAQSDTMKEIRLSVTWTDLKGISHTRQSVTYYARNGLSDFFYRAI